MIHRLGRSAALGTELNQQAVIGQSDEAISTGASSSNIPPADSQEKTPTGVVQVSLDSESDQALSPPEEGSSSDEDLATQPGATSSTTRAYPEHTLQQKTLPDGRVIYKVSLPTNQSSKAV